MVRLREQQVSVVTEGPNEKTLTKWNTSRHLMEKSSSDLEGSFRGAHARNMGLNSNCAWTIPTSPATLLCCIITIIAFNGGVTNVSDIGTKTFLSISITRRCNPGFSPTSCNSPVRDASRRASRTTVCRAAVNRIRASIAKGRLRPVWTSLSPKPKRIAPLRPHIDSIGYEGHGEPPPSMKTGI